MRSVKTFLALALFAASTVQADEVRQSPDWTRSSASGDSITLSEAVDERPVILLFWATWCPYCKALMPHLQSIELEYGDDVRVLALHFRDDKGDPIAFIENAGYDFTLIPDSGDLAEQYGVWGTPGVLIVDKDRNIRFDLYQLPRYERRGGDGSASHGKKAAYRAPYWAAQIRQSLDDVLSSYE